MTTKILRWCALPCFVFVVAAMVQLCQQESISDDSKTDEREWKWPVAIPKTADADLQRSAKRLSAVLSMPDTLWLAESNPVCCLWLEVKQWNPNPSEPGYVIILQKGGGRIIASDIDQLNKAIDRIQEMRKVKGDRVILPNGLLTNYRIIAQ